MKLTEVLLAFSIFSLSACVERGPEAFLSPEQYINYPLPERPPADTSKRAKQRMMDPGYPRPNYTYASGPPWERKGHGIQVEYFAEDGRSYLWYPGNSRVVAGR